MRYISLFSGIEAASVAWQPLGWDAVAFSEIEPFPCAVLKYHYPSVPNLGDVKRIDGHKYHGSVDLIVGGSPCQDFSIANQERRGLAGERSGLAREFVRIVSEVRPQWFIWENVPGALSTNEGRDFGQILEEMDKCGYGLAWRVLDAQFFGVPQRRRRVFVIGYFGDWRPSAAVLFESEGLRRDIEEGKKKRQRITNSFERCAGKRSAMQKRITGTLTARSARGTNDDNMAADGFCVPRYCPSIVEQAISCKWTKGASGPAGDEHHNLIAQPNMRVRRLTVTECERLMGFPDGYTAIEYRGKPASDSVRYKALGNSMVTNVMRWIGARITSTNRRLENGGSRL